MQKRLMVGFFVLVLIAGLSGPGLAWNTAGHMVSGAIAYHELQETNPEALARVVAILKEHQDFQAKWAPQIAQPFVPPDERDLYLFMLAARWPDDIRRNRDFDRPPWHYINFPYKPEGQPASVQTVDPPAENILSTYTTNLDIARSPAPNNERAIALCWIFHLTGDVHQPLHTAKLFITQFPAPEGDRGGTRFYIRVREGRATISLHEFWDYLMLGSCRFQTVRNKGTAHSSAPTALEAQGISGTRPVDTAEA